MDLCYLYVVAHGNSNPGGANHGIQLFTDENVMNKYLSPSELRQAIDAKNGIFVVMLEICYSGIFILNMTDVESSSLSEEQIVQLNAEASVFIEDYVNELVNYNLSDVTTMASGGNTLAGSNKIKVLGSSGYNEISQFSSSATEAWEGGAGPNMLADFNNDGRISLHELFYHSDYMMDINPATSSPVCYPENDSFIIFENHF